MNRFVVVMAGLLSTPVFAEPLSVSKSKAREFVLSREYCVFAAGGVLTKARDGDSRVGKISAAALPTHLLPVLCVFDGTENEGTISEKKGCMAGTFDLSTGKYSDLDVFAPLYGQQNGISFPIKVPVQIAPGPCTRRTVLDLLVSRRIQVSQTTFSVWQLAGMSHNRKDNWGGAIQLQTFVDTFDVKPLLGLKAKDREAALAAAETRTQGATTAPATNTGDQKPGLLDGVKKFFK